MESSVRQTVVLVGAIMAAQSGGLHPSGLHAQTDSVSIQVAYLASADGGAAIEGGPQSEVFAARRLALRVGGGAVLHDAGQGVLSVGAAIPLMRWVQVRPDVSFGFGDDFRSRTASAAVLLLPFPQGALDPYAGGGLALYHESSDATGTRFSRSAPAWLALVGVQARIGGPTVFVEARAIGGRYGEDEFIRSTRFNLPQVVAGVAIHPFGS
jgi:hypothetical protein